MSMCPYIINVIRGPSRCWYVVKISTTHPPPPLAVKVIAHSFIGRGGDGWGGQTDRQTDRLADIVVYREVTLKKKSTIFNFWSDLKQDPDPDPFFHIPLHRSRSLSKCADLKHNKFITVAYIFLLPPPPWAGNMIEIEKRGGKSIF